MPMSQNEIDDISNSFLEAWSEYFGMDVYYQKNIVPVYPSDYLYDENPNKERSEYLGPIKATKIENVTELKLEEFGLTKDCSAIFTFITKELEGTGVTVINNKDIIKTSELGQPRYEVVDYARSTQFVNTFVFTSVGVVNYAD